MSPAASFSNAVLATEGFMAREICRWDDSKEVFAVSGKVRSAVVFADQRIDEEARRRLVLGRRPDVTIPPSRPCDRGQPDVVRRRHGGVTRDRISNDCIPGHAG